MKITEIESVRIPFYATRAQVAHDFHMSLGTIDSRLKEIEAAKSRYGEFAVIREDIIRVNLLAFLDYLKFRKRLLDKNLRKGVPEYDPISIAKELGLLKIGEL